MIVDANKFMRDVRGGGAITGTRLLDQEVLELKRGWYKLFAHCLEHINYCRYLILPWYTDWKQ